MENIQKAIDILNQGRIIIFPTDTAFGIGCRMDREDAIKKLFTIRQRPETQAVPVLVSGQDMAQHYLQELSVEVKQLMKKYWPGGLTIVYPCQVEKVSSRVRGGGNTLGVRMPDHEVALRLIKGIGVPLLAPSANFHGNPTPYSMQELDPELVKLVDYVVPGECKTKQASTVVDCSVEPWKILRQGSVIIDKLLNG